jgi:hypothetical protein
MGGEWVGVTFRVIRAGSVYWTSIFVIVVKLQVSGMGSEGRSAPKDRSSSGLMGKSGLSAVFSMVILWIFVSSKDSYFFRRKVLTSVLMDCFTK